MTGEERTIKNFIQEIIKAEGLVAADQFSTLAIEVFGEEGASFYISEDKREELNKLLVELNEEIHATQEAHESAHAKATGYQSLIKPFSDLFYYLSENIHEKRAKNLAMEAVQLFLQESFAGLLESTINADNISKIKDITLEAINAYGDKSKGLGSATIDKISEVKDKLSDAEENLTGSNNKGHSASTASGASKGQAEGVKTDNSSRDASNQSSLTSSHAGSSQNGKRAAHKSTSENSSKDDYQKDNKNSTATSRKKKLASA